MNRTALKLTATAAAALIGGLGLTACSDSSADTTDTGGAAGTTAVAAADSGSSETTVFKDGDSTVATGGEWSASVDGTPVEIADATVVCVEQGDSVSLSVGSTSATMDSATGLSAVLGTGDNPEVQAVGMGSTETGDALAYAPEMPGNEATATKKGDTYEITGTLTSVDMNNPMAGPQEKSFEFSVTCP